MKVYICGPISGIVDGNKESFFNAERKLLDFGYEVSNPHTFCKNLEPCSIWADFMRVCIPELCSCDGIYVLDGATSSNGARLEMLIAGKLGIYTVTDLDLI